MAEASVNWLVNVAKVVGKSAPFFGTAVGFVTLVYDLGTQLIVGGLGYVSARLDGLDTSTFQTTGFGVIEAVGTFNAVFPLAEALTVWSALATAMITVITIRWVKSVIPTVSN